MKNNSTNNFSFNERVWTACEYIPKGAVSTYKELAVAIKTPKAARAVGNALNKNPFAPHVPCHRVVLSSGFLGGYAHGLTKKVKLLKQEGIKIKNNKVVNFTAVLVTAKILKVNL